MATRAVPLIEAVGRRSRHLTLGDTPKVGLVVFGFDSGQRAEPRWKKHLERLSAAIREVRTPGELEKSTGLSVNPRRTAHCGNRQIGGNGIKIDHTPRSGGDRMKLGTDGPLDLDATMSSLRAMTGLADNGVRALKGAHVKPDPNGIDPQADMSALGRFDALSLRRRFRSS